MMTRIIISLASYEWCPERTHKFRQDLGQPAPFAVLPSFELVSLDQLKVFPHALRGPTRSLSSGTHRVPNTPDAFVMHGGRAGGRARILTKDARLYMFLVVSSCIAIITDGVPR